MKTHRSQSPPSGAVGVETARRFEPRASVHVMKDACLVNQYPKVSHAFSRREILAVEKEGFGVVRWRIRRSIEPLLDSLDVEEATKTHVLLDAGWWKMVREILRVLRTRPGRFLRALRHAVRAGFGSERGILRHLAYLAKACVLVGWADRGAIIKVLDDSRALVLPCFAEGLPVAILEALARARPVLSRFVAGIPELAVPGRNAWRPAPASN